MKVIDNFEGRYRFLSNFFPWPIVDEHGITWPSTEHYYQAAKTEDPVWRMKMIGAPFYKKDCISGQRPIKSLGRSCPMRPDWDDVRLEVMERALRMKFVAGNKMAFDLVATRDAQLIEGNTWGDTFFGVCNGQGENNLGKLLMKIREELRATPEHLGQDQLGDLW